MTLEREKLEEIFILEEDDSKPYEIILGDVKILNVAYIGRNGRIYLNVNVADIIMIWCCYVRKK